MFLFSLLVNSKGTVCFSVSPARAHVRALVSGYDSLYASALPESVAMACPPSANSHSARCYRDCGVGQPLDTHHCRRILRNSNGVESTRM